MRAESRRLLGVQDRDPAGDRVTPPWGEPGALPRWKQTPVIHHPAQDTRPKGRKPGVRDTPACTAHSSQQPGNGSSLGDRQQRKSQRKRGRGHHRAPSRRKNKEGCVCDGMVRLEPLRQAKPGRPRERTAVSLVLGGEAAGLRRAARTGQERKGRPGGLASGHTSDRGSSAGQCAWVDSGNGD